MTESPPPKRPKKPRRGCLGEILALLGAAAFLGIPQLRPLAMRLSARQGPDGQLYVTDPAAGFWVVYLGTALGSALLLAGLILAAADWRRRRAAARAAEKEEKAPEEGEAPNRPR